MKAAQEKSLGPARPSVPAKVAQTPVQKAAYNGRWAETMFRALTARVGRRWKFVSFRGTGGAEWRGIVDILAVRKCTKSGLDAGLKAGDLFDFVLVQLKGGDAPMPTKADTARLLKVAAHYHALRVVLYAWKSGTHSKYYILQPDGSWTVVSAADAFV